MRAVVQRVTSACVKINNTLVSEIGFGFLVLLGIKDDDTKKDKDYIIRKIMNLRIFSDDQDRMNKSIVDVSGEILLVSQFTLYGDCRKGNRPSFVQAMLPQEAEKFYTDFSKSMKQVYPKLKEGVFGAHMQVGLTNDGPVTIFLDSR